MKRLVLIIGLGLLLVSNLAEGQNEVDEAGSDADTGEESEEECDEAWEYLEFLKTSIKEKIEKILQDTLFEPRPLLDATIADTMTQTLEIRDAVLNRTKAIRTENGDVVICPEQGVNQENFLNMLRMDVMTILLSLIEPDAASRDKLQEIGRELLSVRTKVNGEITRIIMLREAGGTARKAPEGECDCGILSDIVEGLDRIIDGSKSGEEDDSVVVAGDEDVTEASDVDDSDEGDGDEPVGGLTMVLMDIDNRIGVLYNDILGQLDEAKRRESSDELKFLKSVSIDLNEIITEMADIDGDTDDGARKLQKLLTRDTAKVRNNVDRQLTTCRESCPSDCDSCGAEKIDELSSKLQDYRAIIEDLSEDEAKESVRNDLIAFLTQANQDMTELLTQKAESNGTLEPCDFEKLEVLESIKGPLWMMVNITLYGDGQTLNDMITALEAALNEIRGKYCSAEPRTAAPEPDDENTCDLDEINTTRDWIADIDTIISDNLFKVDEEESEGRVNAMLGFIGLKSNMDDRVRQLFQDGLKCNEEVEQIKNIYMNQITNCLAEMMNPRFRFETLARAERVACIKQLRVTMEDRRGELLLREIERRIQEQAPPESSIDATA